MLVDGRNSEDSIFSNVGMSVLETRSCRRQARLNKLSLSELRQESQCISPDIFIGMLQVIPDAITFDRVS